MSRLLFVDRIDRWAVDRERLVMTLYFVDDVGDQTAIQIPCQALRASLPDVWASLQTRLPHGASLLSAQ